MIKLTYLLKRRSDVAPDEFAERWAAGHTALVKGHAELLGAERYVLSVREATPCDRCLADSRGLPEPTCDAVLEIGWKSIADYQAGMGSAAGLKVLDAMIDAERRLIDFSRSQAFFTRECDAASYSKVHLSDQTSIDPLIEGLSEPYAIHQSTTAA